MLCSHRSQLFHRSPSPSLATQGRDSAAHRPECRLLVTFVILNVHEFGQLVAHRLRNLGLMQVDRQDRFLSSDAIDNSLTTLSELIEASESISTMTLADSIASTISCPHKLAPWMPPSSIQTPIPTNHPFHELQELVHDPHGRN